MIIATCGHALTQEEDMGINCSIKAYTRENTRCIEYVCYCTDCYNHAVKDGYVLFDEGEENKWMGSTWKN
jgi:hypothetical protein